MSDEIKAKVDVGFVRPQPSAEIIGQAVVRQSKEMRLEALKLAYEVAFRQDIFSRRDWDGKSFEEQVEAYKQVFELADINYQFIVSGEVKLDDK